jgi:hypothetical protein
MPRVLAIMVSLCLLWVFGGGDTAYAEKQTVNGSGDITKLVANNATSKLTAKVLGLGSRCGGAQYLHVFVKNKNGRLLYEADGDCISAQWGVGLYYTSTGVREDEVPVDCPDFAITRNAGAYTVSIPRSCLDHAPNRVKVKVEGANFGTMTGGTAGPTKVLYRG